MTKVFSWLKANKLTFVLLLIIGYFLYQKYAFPLGYQRSVSSPLSVKPQLLGRPSVGGGAEDLNLYPPDVYREAAPAPDVKNRLVISESYLSLLVNNVTEAQKQIIQTAESLGGYMVESNLNNPQDAPTSTVTVRVPSVKLQQALETFRGLAVKVVSENLSGQDVTDEFVDNEARLETLEKTKAKFEEIFDKATRIEDILNVQQQIINIQSQIDALKGQQNYLEKNTQIARLTIYLSTDELALPYAPSETWRPEVIFRQAVRSLIGHLRRLGTALIWLAVYSIVLIPTLLLVRYFMRKVKNGQVL